MSPEPTSGAPAPRCPKCNTLLHIHGPVGRCPFCAAVTPLGEVAPRCLGCAYALQGLKSPGECPECGRAFDLDNPITYSRRPPFMRWKFWLPGLLTAACCGGLTMLVGAYAFKSMGAAVWIGAPVAAGAVLGYRLRAGPLWMVVLGLVLLATLVTGMITFSLGGVFCGMIMAVISCIPLLFGSLLGWTTREILKTSGWDQRSHLPVIFFTLAPMVWAWAEGPGKYAPESISTQVVINAPPDAVWGSIVFYEDVTHEPPWILKVGLARPLRTTGRSESVGDIKRCLYNKGPITKRITAVQPGKLLAFDVIEQQIGYERDVSLVGGSFELEEVEGGATRVVLTTRYVPHLGARFCWRWGERIAVHTLHGYVLEGMRLRAERGVPAMARRAGAP